MSNDLDLSLSLLEGIHEDDHEKITSLKNNSFTNLNQLNNNLDNIDLLLLHLNSSTNINELYSNLFNNKPALLSFISNITHTCSGIKNSKTNVFNKSPNFSKDISFALNIPIIFDFDDQRDCNSAVDEI
jgi:hypothetical protein